MSSWPWNQRRVLMVKIKQLWWTGITGRSRCKFMTNVLFLVDVCGCDTVWDQPVVFLDSPSGVSCMQVKCIWILSRSVTELYSDCWWLLEESWWLMCRWTEQQEQTRVTSLLLRGHIGELWAAWFICSPCFSDFLPGFGEMNVNAAVVTQRSTDPVLDRRGSETWFSSYWECSW